MTSVKNLFATTLFLILISLDVIAQKSTESYTAGSLTFTITSVTNNTTYSPKNCLAIWIKDSQGNFVVSRKVMAASRKQHLIKWNASSGGNSVSATTGATLSNHQTHTITWDGKNSSGADMPDDTYQIWVEYTSTNSAFNGNAGPSVMVEFIKGPQPQHITPNNVTYYKNIVVDWVPLGVGINELSKAGAQVSLFPNPTTDNLNIHLSLDKKSQVAMYVYNLKGEKIVTIEENIMSAGLTEYNWNCTSMNNSKVQPGIYILLININGRTESRRIIVN